MTRSSIHLAVLAGLLLAAAADLVWLYPQLPEHVVTHFGLDGVGGRLVSRSSFLLGQIVLLALMGLGFPALRWLVMILPASLMNVPHREYWLAPERVAYLRAVVGDLVLLLGNLNLALVAALTHFILRANLPPRPRPRAQRAPATISARSRPKSLRPGSPASPASVSGRRLQTPGSVPGCALPRVQAPYKLFAFLALAARPGADDFRLQLASVQMPPGSPRRRVVAAHRWGVAVRTRLRLPPRRGFPHPNQPFAFLLHVIHLLNPPAFARRQNLMKHFLW